jgi:hypothetical protein
MTMKLSDRASGGVRQAVYELRTTDYDEEQRDEGPSVGQTDV